MKAFVARHVALLLVLGVPVGSTSYAQEPLGRDDFNRDIRFLDRADRIAVPGYRVMLTVLDGTYAEGRAGAGARVDLAIRLEGVDAALLQELADEGYRDFMSKLATTSKTVVGIEQIQAAKDYAELAKVEVPFIASLGRQVAIGSPAAAPLWFAHFDVPYGDVGPMSLGPQRALNGISVDTKAVLLVPHIEFHFAEMETSGRRGGAGDANVSAEPSLRIVGSKTGAKIIYAKIRLAGDLGMATLDDNIALDSSVGAIVDVVEESNLDEIDPTGFFPEQVKGKITGAYRVDPVRFKAEVLRGIQMFNDGLIAAINEG